MWHGANLIHLALLPRQCPAVTVLPDAQDGHQVISLPFLLAVNWTNWSLTPALFNHQAFGRSVNGSHHGGVFCKELMKYYQIGMNNQGCWRCSLISLPVAWTALSNCSSICNCSGWFSTSLNSCLGYRFSLVFTIPVRLSRVLTASLAAI